MLQIVTRMHFREGVPLYSAVHRQVLYIATYALWHGTTATESNRPAAANLLADHEDH